MQVLKKGRFSPLNTALLTILGIASKVISVMFKIVLIMVIGTVGIGYYQLAFPLFVFLFSLSSVGVATTLTMNIAESGWGTLVNNGGFRFAKKTTIIVTIALSAGLIIIAPLVAKVQGDLTITYIYYSVAFAILSVSLLTFYRAILRGNEFIKPYAISDIVEQSSKLVLSVLLAFLMMRIGEVFAVVGVFIGIATSAIITLLYIKVVLAKKYITTNEVKSNIVFDKKTFLKFSFIAGISSILLPFVQFIDSIVVVRLLGAIGYSHLNATKLFGLSRGNISALINLPNTIILAIEFLLLPDILKISTKDNVSKKCQTTITIAFAIGVLAGAVFFAFSNEILNFAYGNSFDDFEYSVAVILLKIGAFSVLFSSLAQIQSVVLQGIKKLHLPIISLCIASGIKLLFELVFIKELGIYAAEMSNVLFYLSLSLINGAFLIKNKVYFGTPINLLVLLVILLWVILTKLIFNLIVTKISFIFAIILAIFMTSVLSVLLLLFFISKVKKKKQNENFVNNV